MPTLSARPRNKAPYPWPDHILDAQQVQWDNRIAILVERDRRAAPDNPCKVLALDDVKRRKIPCRAQLKSEFVGVKAELVRMLQGVLGRRGRIVDEFEFVRLAMEIAQQQHKVLFLATYVDQCGRITSARGVFPDQTCVTIKGSGIY
jgi:hypothetical protein